MCDGCSGGGQWQGDGEDIGHHDPQHHSTHTPHQHTLPNDKHTHNHRDKRLAGKRAPLAHSSCL